MAIGCKEVILSDQADEAIAALASSKAKEADSIRKRVAWCLSTLRRDAQAGEVVPFPLARPAKPLEARHAPLGNLYCMDLPDFWRLLYTITRVGGDRYVYVLEIVPHADYDRWFPGRKRR